MAAVAPGDHRDGCAWACPWCLRSSICRGQIWSPASRVVLRLVFAVGTASGGGAGCRCGRDTAIGLDGGVRGVEVALVGGGGGDGWSLARSDRIWRWGSAGGPWHRWCVPGGSGAWSSPGDVGRAAAGRGRCFGRRRRRGEVRRWWPVASRWRDGFTVARRFCPRQRPASLASTHLRSDRLDLRPISSSPERDSLQRAGPSSSRARGSRTGRWMLVLAGLLGLDAGGRPGVRKLGPFRSSLSLGLRQVSGEVVSRSWMPGRRPWWWQHGALGRSPCLGAARAVWAAWWSGYGVRWRWVLAEVKTCSIFGRTGGGEDRSLLGGVVGVLIARHAALGETLILGLGGGGAPVPCPSRRHRLGAHGASYVASSPRRGSARGGVAALSAYVSCSGCVRVLRWRVFVLDA
ncbi:uncharacterized protein LOC119324178 [Triticum dicoccoides]|uniref:uncharacterized protein LOC119324178 n=1 Tax=Triticum dicoccoides TaxID=85692 RepID=UPI001890E51A|nr:uncharacterized protein LOC119324178 [Triticum dicoccoides]